MIGWCSWGAVNLTWMIEYAVQTGRAWIVSLKWIFPLTGLRATKSGIDSRVVGVIAIISMLVSIASGLAIAISGFRSARFT